MASAGARTGRYAIERPAGQRRRLTRLKSAKRAAFGSAGARRRPASPADEPGRRALCQTRSSWFPQNPSSQAMSFIGADGARESIVRPANSAETTRRRGRAEHTKDIAHTHTGESHREGGAYLAKAASRPARTTPAAGSALRAARCQRQINIGGDLFILLLVECNKLPHLERHLTGHLSRAPLESLLRASLAEAPRKDNNNQRDSSRPRRRRSLLSARQRASAPNAPSGRTTMRGGGGGADGHNKLQFYSRRSTLAT